MCTEEQSWQKRHGIGDRRKKLFQNFIEQEIDKDLAEGVYDNVHTIFSPE